MRRKRFVRLLMSHKISRNDAVQMASYYCKRGISYSDAWGRQKFNCVRMNVCVEKFARSMNAILKELNAWHVPCYQEAVSFHKLYCKHLSVLKTESEDLLGRAITISSGSTRSLMDEYDSMLRRMLSGQDFVHDSQTEVWRKNDGHA